MARRITLHLELTHSGRSSARLGGRISVSASFVPPACSPLAGDGSAGCRRWRGGGGAGQDTPGTDCPAAGLPTLPQHGPTQGRLPLRPRQGLAVRGGSPPARLYVCGWEGGGPAPNYIKDISTAWLSSLRCLHFACLPWGRAQLRAVGLLTHGWGVCDLCFCSRAPCMYSSARV